MDNKLLEKIGSNALITEKLIKLSQSEKQKIVVRLLMTRTEQQLSEDLGIPKSTLHDWKSGRQDNTEGLIHISLGQIVSKLRNLKPENINDWGRIQQINEITANLLRKKQ